MNIAFDAKRITNNATGLGNYSRFIVDSLATYYPSNNYMMCSPSRGNKLYYEHILKHKSACLLTPDSSKVGSLWRNFGVVKALKEFKTDVYHGLSNELPLGIYSQSIPTVVTIHDLIFLRYPQYYKHIDRWLYAKKYGLAARKADKVIAISETTKRDIIDFFNVPEERIDVVYQGCAPDFAKASLQDIVAVKQKYKLSERYILYVGSIESRKNLDLVVRSLALLKDKDICLIAIGKKTPYTDIVSETIILNKLQQRVQLLHQVPFADLPALYKDAEVFVYPSKFEGFGIPIIEAISARIPVIGATGSCLEEAGGDGCLYTDPNNAEMLADMLESVLNDNDLRSRMVSSSQKYIERFAPAQIASDLMNVYNSVL